ncbi:MAG: hypothetical protein Q7Q71_14165 [Verrucomicrobiota bacterium JB023]|nr:hypothetical protein [Verrucomicrobiota bacterium JB023]
MRTLVLFFTSCSVAFGQSSSASYQIDAQVLDAGGGASSSASYSFTASSIGGIVGRGSSETYELGSGPVEQFINLLNRFTGIDLRDYSSWIGQFASLVMTGRGDDPDGDGRTNEEEFLALTDPTDEDSRLEFRLDSVDQVSDEVTLLFAPYVADDSLRRYRLLSHDDLRAPLLPLPGLSPFVGPLSGEGIFVDDQTMSAKRFYQLEISIPTE